MSRVHTHFDSPSTSGRMLAGILVLFAALLILTPVTGAHAAYFAFLVTAAICARISSGGALESVEVGRLHHPRVFEGDKVPVSLLVRQTKGLAQPMVLVEDQFFASLSITQRHLIPMMARGWEARLQYVKEAERHRGIYVLGPARLWAADPLGIFSRGVEAGGVTPLTVYPRAVPLGGCKLLGPHPPSGNSLEVWRRIGQGEEIISVRPYQPGDPPSRIHWRTSARLGKLHTIQLDAHVQAETAIFLDLARPGRYGTGIESTPEVAIGCAVSLLSEAAAQHQRISLTMIRESVESFPAGEGLAHLHSILDRLAVASVAGDLPFWEAVEPRLALLRQGSRAIFIVVAARTLLETAGPLIQRLVLRGLGVDVILLDEGNMTRIWREQEPPLANHALHYEELREALVRSGARVFPIARGETALALLPAVQAAG